MSHHKNVLLLIYRDEKHHTLIGNHTKRSGYQQKSNKARTVTALSMVTEMQIQEGNTTHGDIKIPVPEETHARYSYAKKHNLKKMLHKCNTMVNI